MSRFTVEPTPLLGLVRVQRVPLEDARGFLCRIFCAETFAQLGIQRPLAQINHTLTRQAGTVRGLHFQRPPHAEAKLVGCLRGRIWDVAVDLRGGSPTFLQWHAEELSAANGRSLFIPEGFAHGFQTLEADCELLYLHSAAHVAEAEGALNALDPRLGITWPRPVVNRSERDASHPFLQPDFQGITL